MSNQLANSNPMDAAALEKVLIGGDLSTLTPKERMQYYKQVCESIGLNPLTKPFDYISLKSKEGNKLTLYAKKDATDQLRNLKGVSIDDVDIQEKDKFFLVKVKGHDKTGRTDVEIGVVNKADMFGDAANVQMKAVTKAKRRLTLSLCGLGWLDETEIETIPDAKPVVVAETGEIIDGQVKEVSATDQFKQETGAIEEISYLDNRVVSMVADAKGLSKQDAVAALNELLKAGRIEKKMKLAEFEQII